MNIFNPSPEDYHYILEKQNLAKELLDVQRPLINPIVLDKVLCTSKYSLSEVRDLQHHPIIRGSSTLSSTVEHAIEARMLLDKINARRLIHAEYILHNLEAEVLDGYSVKLEIGNLGFMKAY